MSHTGTYVLTAGHGMVKVSDAVPSLARPVYFPSGGAMQGYYDRSARRQFRSPGEKRAWMKRWGMREGGLITSTDRRLDGHWRNPHRLSWPQRQEKAARHAWIQSQGGTEGLLRRVRERRGNFL